MDIRDEHRMRALIATLGIVSCLLALTIFVAMGIGMPSRAHARLGGVGLVTPAAALDYLTTRTALLRDRIASTSHRGLAALASFEPGAATGPPPSTQAPGGPILVVTSPGHPFSRYFVEILRAEGLNEFTEMDVSLVTPASLRAYDVVVLGEIPIDDAQAASLTSWTRDGGTLIAMRPDARLAGVLGLTRASGSLSDGYLLVDTASGPGVGIVGETIQFHGTADRWKLNGARSVATLYSDAVTRTGYPAVTLHGVGSNGGKAAAFTYDLARSVVYTRQGNPAWAGQKRDGEIPPRRADDLFFGNAALDPRPDWVNLDKVAIPQADEQQRLFANLIVTANLHRMPLPRLWYLPKGLKATVVMTGDDHGDTGMKPRFDLYRAQSPAGCSVDDWECVRATGYLYIGTAFTPAQARFYDALGFEVALHVNTECEDLDARALDTAYQNQLSAFTAALPSIAAPSTSRTHCIAWCDWSTQADVEVAHGIRFDTNYYYWPDSWVRNRPGMFTGSGFPMRFARLDGSIIDCYQAATQMPDESGLVFPQFCDRLLDRANGPEGYYGVFVANMHFDNLDHPGSNAIVASARAHGVPVVSARQMLNWLDGRNASSFRTMSWANNTLSFTVAPGAGARNMRGMLPLVSAVGALGALTRNGSAIAWETRTVKGIQCAFFPAERGDYVATYRNRARPLAGAVATPATSAIASQR